MVATVGIRVSEGRAFSVFSLATTEIRGSQARAYGIINFPTADMRISQARELLPVKRNSAMDVSQARVFAIVKGRTANPRVRAWTATLDGHDFYFLRLGDGLTLVYDTASEQWIEWDSQDSGAWRPNIGANWIGAQALAHRFGSDIVAGDDTFGLLWFLDPELPYDEAPDLTRGTQQLYFNRIVTGQVLAKNRQYLPCYAVFVAGDNYGLVAQDFTPNVVLETSDDQGRTWDAHDTLTVVADYKQDDAYAWYSLGQISSPGRLFRITDNGLFTRIDALGMNDDAG